MRVPTLQHARQVLQAIGARQGEQARIQARIASGLRVQSPGDDPAAAAQAELARSRLALLAQQGRATDVANTRLGSADTALGRGIDVLESARDALVAAGNAGLTAPDRQALALQLRSARDQLLAVANSEDGAGGWVFGGQGASAAPFSSGSSPAFTAAAGDQGIGDDGRFTASLDGRAVFMDLPQGNGVFTTSSAPGNTGTGWIGTGSVVDAAQLTGHGYAITVGGTAAAPTLTVTDTTSGSTVLSGAAYQPGGDITVDGQRVRLNGAPAVGDRFTLAPAGRQSVFAMLDQAATLLEGGGSAPATNEGLDRALAGVDRALDSLRLARTRNGEELRSVQSAADDASLDTVNTTARRKDLRDLDMAQAITDLQASQTAGQAALQSYAATQRKSLFDLLG